jgi:zinc transport system permease protein
MVGSSPPLELFAQAGPNWLDRAIDALTTLAPADTFFSYSYNIRALLALVLVGLSCGAVGSLVVGSRMAFFSDALAHCAFAGVSIGFLLFKVALVAFANPNLDFWEWVTPVMVAFGVLVGYGIAAVRMRTGLASDTVIGVFFAGAVGLAAMLRKLMQNRQVFYLEDFLFGDPLTVSSADLTTLALLAAATFLVLAWLYNWLLLTSFNNSLALSRRVPVRWCNYLFVMLLAVIVNLCLRCVGVLLINALLVVPAATAMNVSRNLRQLFRWTLGLCVVVSLAGQWLSWEVEMAFSRGGMQVRLGIPGTIILLYTVLFVASMLLGPWYRSRKTA